MELKNKSLHFHQTIDFRRTFNENILKIIVVVKTQLKEKMFCWVSFFVFSFFLFHFDRPLTFRLFVITWIVRQSNDTRWNFGPKFFVDVKKQIFFSMKNFRRLSTFEKCPIAEFRSTSFVVMLRQSVFFRWN